jgi:hypothetical protein
MVENIQQKRLFRNQSRICSKNLVQVTNLRNSGDKFRRFLFCYALYICDAITAQ